MKKLLFLLLSIVSMLPVFAREFKYTYEGSTLGYTVLDEEAKTCEVSSRWTNSSDGLIIPETASDGNVEYSVISIVDRLFYNDNGLTSVTIPNSVTAIGDYVFYGCEFLTSVTIPNSVTSIGDHAFASCARLRSVVIPDSVTSIGDYAFAWCGMLTSVTIPNSVTSIGYRAFIWCVELNSLTLPDSLTSIGDYAFYGCEKITSVTIPNSVTSIGNYAFSICPGLTSVTIPNSVTSIGDYAFDRSGLTSVTIPNSVTSINCGTFSECKNLTEVIFSPSIEKIGDCAFNGCIRLESLIIGPNLKEIGDEAFKSCKISNLYITTPAPPALPDGLSNFSDSPEGHRTTFFQNEAIRENYQSELWNKYVFLLEEGGETALMVEPTELSVEGGISLMGRPGETFQLSAKLYPEDVTLPYVFWRSTNPEIASVDYDGLVTIHADLSEATPLDEGDGSQVACHIIAETLYSDGPIVEIPVGYNQSTGITDVVGGDSSSDIDPNAPVEVFTIQGIKVSDSIDKLSAGIYIVRQGNKVKKISVQ